MYVLDSGVCSSHDGFLESDEWGVPLKEGKARVENGPTFGGHKPADVDTLGHGTHIARTIGGNRFGVENVATIVSVRVSEGGKGRHSDSARGFG